MEYNTFTRDFEVESKNKTLVLHQQQIGDVSCVVWDAALVLAKYLDYSCDKNNWLEGKNVLELGAGVGCVGMTAACLGAHVVMTDLESTIPMLERNISENQEQWRGIGSARAQILDWRENIRIDFVPDIVLLADCVYYMESVQPLLKTLESLCNSKSQTYAIFSQEKRDTPIQLSVWNKFSTELMKLFKLKDIPLSEQHPKYSSEDINLIKLTLAN